MKKAQLIFALSAITLTSGAFLTSCGSDEEICNVGYEGKDCKDEVRTKYYNTYRGTASDNDSGTYTNWAIKYSASGTVATNMKMEILDDNNANVFLFDAVLKTNETFDITPKSTGGFDYTGNGSVNANATSFTLTERDPLGVETTLIYNFTNFTK